MVESVDAQKADQTVDKSESSVSAQTNATSDERQALAQKLMPIAVLKSSSTTQSKTDEESKSTAINEGEDNVQMDQSEVEKQQAELLGYICEILCTISTGDEEKDFESIEVVADSVHAKAESLH